MALVICLLWNSPAFSAEAVGSVPVAATPQQFFESVKGLVFPLKTAVHAEDPKKSYGTAFVVDPSGILATNYHVVSDVVRDPAKYNLYLEVPGSEEKGGALSISAEILAFDIVHDLALVKVERAFSGAFPLPSERDPIPTAAERIWSLGKPLDLSMALVEGNFNGELGMGDFAKFFLSTPINPGMSGGPTVDAAGIVRGVNFAILLKTQNVSFAVPARYLVRLLGDWRDGKYKPPGTLPPGPSERRDLFRKWIEIQMAESGGKMVDEFLAVASAGDAAQNIKKGGVTLARFPSNLKCWQDQIKKSAVGDRPSLGSFLKPGEDDEEVAAGSSEMTLTLTSCHTGFSVDLAEGLDVGDLKFGLAFLEPGRVLVTPRDWRLFGAKIGALSEKLLSGFLDEREGGGRRSSGREGEVCRRTPVKNAGGMDLELSFCVDRFRNQPLLLDSAVRITGVLKTGEAVLLGMHARGFRLEDLRRLTSRLLDGMSVSDSPGSMPVESSNLGRTPAAAADRPPAAATGGE
jgi:hypothetical protein